MSLKEQITEDMKTAMRAKDAERLGTIRLLLSALKQKEVDERIELDDVAVVAIVDKLIKQRKDSIAAFEQAARQDLADKEKAEMAVLVGYLPARMSAEEVTAAVQSIVADLGAKAFSVFGAHGGFHVFSDLFFECHGDGVRSNGGIKTKKARRSVPRRAFVAL